MLPATKCHWSSITSAQYRAMVWDGRVCTPPDLASLLMPRRPHTGSRAPTGVRLLSPFEGSGAPQQILKLRVYIDNKSFARRCAQGRFQISYCAANGLPPKGISEERHKRLLAEDVIDDIHALQMECRALLRCRAVPLDVFLLRFDAKCCESSTPITFANEKLRRHKQRSLAL